MKRTVIILTGYAFVLLACAVISYFLPRSHETLAISHDAKSLQQLQEAQQSFYEAANHGDLEQTEDILIDGEQHFEYDGDQLVIASLNGANPIQWAIIERKNTDDGLIEATYFTTRTVFGGVELTEQIPPVVLRLDGDRLTMQAAEQRKYRLTFAAFRNEFTITQFSNTEERNDDRAAGALHMGLRAIHLKIPQNLQIVDQSDTNLIWKDPSNE